MNQVQEESYGSPRFNQGSLREQRLTIEEDDNVIVEEPVELKEQTLASVASL